MPAEQCWQDEFELAVNARRHRTQSTKQTKPLAGRAFQLLPASDLIDQHNSDSWHPRYASNCS